jgi:hypothetical protein
MRTFDTLFTELAGARSRYEDLRRNGAAFGDRLDAKMRLDELRAQMGAMRRSHT